MMPSRRTAALLFTLFAAGCSAAGTQSRSDVSRAGFGDYTQRDFQCLREAVYFEAGAGSEMGGRAVANVIMNRAADPRFPGTICGVVTDGQARGACQFSYRCDSRPEALTDKKKLANATRAATAALQNPDEDVSKGALFFHAAWMKPGWFGTLTRTVALGGNVFYR